MKIKEVVFAVACRHLFCIAVTLATDDGCILNLDEHA